MSRPFDAVITDLDGTIVRSGAGLSPATESALAALREAGVPVIVSTARTPDGVRLLGPVRSQFTAAVCSNGAVGLEPSSGDLHWRIPVAALTVRRLLSALAEQLPEAEVGAYDGRAWSVTAGYEAARGWLPGGSVDVSSSDLIARIEAVALIICHPELSAAEVLAVLQAAGIDADTASMSYGIHHLLDIAPAGLSKGTGVLRMLAHLDIDPARAIAFGDGHNDLPMFAVVGTSVAMGNAELFVQAAATMVTAHVDDDGFARTLAELGAIPRSYATTQNTLPSVSASTTKSASGG